MSECNSLEGRPLNINVKRRIGRSLQRALEISKSTNCAANSEAMKTIKTCIRLLQEQDLKLSELESENGKMKVEHEEFRTEATQSQLFELRAQSDEERATKQSEVNLLMEIPDPIFISYGGSRHTILRLGSTPTKIEVHIPCRFKVPPMLLGCCNGIICLGNYHKMVLWNPCNGTFITIKDTPSLGSYGFGYTEDDYYLIKVLPTILTKPRGGFGHTKVAKVELSFAEKKKTNKYFSF
ncbi:hypothetical protein L3X38_043489 [Prunus dulcis]|uniref:Uncharacterized protein n=1 Tax=Prunus dulcis TaxID=3755 RepID=A0AAD4UX79_PRUDU|nr:hypothetical protein L3X38_043489 [Prunus dulcis]